VVVLEDPVLENGDQHYIVRIIDGDMPIMGANASVFIDVIGMPLTLVSIWACAARMLGSSRCVVGHGRSQIVIVTVFGAPHPMRAES
jgi:hypothetical protein